MADIDFIIYFPVITVMESTGEYYGEYYEKYNGKYFLV